mgnify:CR=1 FL=1
MEFTEALQEFLFHQGFQRIKYDSKIYGERIPMEGYRCLRLFLRYYRGRKRCR